MTNLKSTIFCALLATACAAVAGVRWQSYEVSIGTNATAAVTDSHPVIGAIDQVHIENASAANVTSTVTFVAAPSIGTNLASTVVYTNAAHTTSIDARPRFLGTDTAGSDLSSLAVAEPFVCVGDTVTFRLVQTSAVTGITVRAWIKLR